MKLVSAPRSELKDVRFDRASTIDSLLKVEVDGAFLANAMRYSGIGSAVAEASTLAVKIGFDVTMQPFVETGEAAAGTA